MPIDFANWQRKALTSDSIAAPEVHGSLIHRDSTGMQMASLVDPVIDPVRMYARAVINTDAIDYQDEVILAKGVRLGNYQRNPVVLWDHGRSITTLPIGRSDGPDGELDIVRNDRMIEAGTYFAKSFPFAYQVFALIDERVIRATSISVIPSLVAQYRSPDGREILVTEESDLIEFSWTPLGVNPEAIGGPSQKSLLPDPWLEAAHLQMDRAIRVLNRGSLGGEPLNGAIRKSLLAMVPKPKGQLIKPFDDAEEPMAKDTLTKSEIRGMGKARLKSLDVANYDDETKERIAKALAESEQEKAGTETVADDAAVKSGTEEVQVPAAESQADEAFQQSDAESEDVEEAVTKAVDAEAAEASEIESGPTKLGARILTELFDALAYAKTYFTEAVGPLENEAVRSGIAEMLDELSDLADATRGLYAAAYPEMPALGSEEEVDEDAEMAVQIKSMLAASRQRQFQTLGIQSLLNAVKTSPNLTPSQRKSLIAIDSKISRLVKSAANFVPPVPAGYVPQSQFDAVVGQRDRLLKTVEKIEQQVMPAS